MSDPMPEHEHSSHHHHPPAPAPAAQAGHPDTVHTAHDKHAGHHPAMFRDRFWISLALTVPTLFWADMIQQWLGYRAPSFSGSNWIPAIGGTAVFVYGGRVFLQGAVRELRARLPGMMTLIALAITVAFV
ncbi:MAG TPA: hypothetical protein VK864_18165, partial [Longimicrobiales bacterium]|nr:hypothetical protein [Longimicrobiales bacterium]